MVAVLTSTEQERSLSRCIAAYFGYRRTVSRPGTHLYRPQVHAPKPKMDADAPVAGQDYMKQYLVEMDGDDSQFKDIDPNVAAGSRVSKIKMSS